MTIHLVANLPFTYKILFLLIVTFASIFDLFMSALLILESYSFPLHFILRLFILFVHPAV